MRGKQGGGGRGARAGVVRGARGLRDPTTDRTRGRRQRRRAPGLTSPNADLWLSFEDSTVASDGLAGLRRRQRRSGGRHGGRGRRRRGPLRDRRRRRLGRGLPGSCATSRSAARGRWSRSPPRRRSTPATGTSSYGAQVWLAADQTTTGSNIVQKGRFGTDGGQWKLQVDSEEGEPSCVVRGAAPGAEPWSCAQGVDRRLAVAPGDLSPRRGRAISIEVDGERADEPRCHRVGRQRVAAPGRRSRGRARTTTSSTAWSTTSTSMIAP